MAERERATFQICKVVKFRGFCGGCGQMGTVLNLSKNELVPMRRPRFSQGFSILVANCDRALSGSVAASNSLCRGASYRASQTLASNGRKRICVEFGTNGEVSFDSRRLFASSRNHQSKIASLFVEGL